VEKEILKNRRRGCGKSVISRILHKNSIAPVLMAEEAGLAGEAPYWML
jgi:hypothetical protein